jgi:glycosyltransferase involved in cell wall biosynthesis
MRIQFVIQRLSGGGAERVVANLASALCRRGHTVEIVLLADRTDADYALNTHVMVRSLKVDSVSHYTLQRLTSNIRRVIAVRRAVRAFRPDIAAGFIAQSAITVAFACLGLPCRTIGCERTYPPNALGSRSWRFMRAIAYRLLDVVTVQTEGAADWVRGHLAVKDLVVVPNWVAEPEAADAASPIISSVIAPSDRLVLAVGRLQPEKGFSQLIDAFGRAFADCPCWNLAILGEGAMRPALEAQVDALGLGGRVHLPGSTPHVAAWYARADIFALSSSSEGFPNVLGEALAHGTPAVSFDCNQGPREILRDEVDGLLIPNGDVNAFAVALGRLAADDTLRARLGARAVEVKSRFPEEGILDRWERLFAALLHARSTKRTWRFSRRIKG